jgi:hypothetical protein
LLGRVVSPKAARWLPEDRAKVIAYSIEQGSRCVTCGTAEWQWEEDEHAFEAVAKSCPGCQRRDWLREDNPELGQQAGVSITLVSRAEAKRIRDTPKKRPRRRRANREE